MKKDIIVIPVETPHVKIPGVQILRPHEIQLLLDREKARDKKESGTYVKIMNYELIIKPEDIDKEVEDFFPDRQNPKKARPNSAAPALMKSKKKEEVDKLKQNFKKSQVKFPPKSQPRKKADIKYDSDEDNKNPENNEPQEDDIEEEKKIEKEDGEEKVEEDDLGGQQENGNDLHIDEGNLEEDLVESVMEPDNNNEEEEGRNDETAEKVLEKSASGAKKSKDMDETVKNSSMTSSKKPMYQSYMANLMQDMLSDLNDEGQLTKPKRTAKK